MTGDDALVMCPRCREPRLNATTGRCLACGCVTNEIPRRSGIHGRAPRNPRREDIKYVRRQPGGALMMEFRRGVVLPSDHPVTASIIVGSGQQLTIDERDPAFVAAQSRLGDPWDVVESLIGGIRLVDGMVRFSNGTARAAGVIKARRWVDRVIDVFVPVAYREPRRKAR